ncbi:MAG: ammonium transporter [Phycisphaeraceae bacterium]|nr:ammonium transporter [Phycisphaeraceae bacterium]
MKRCLPTHWVLVAVLALVAGLTLDVPDVLAQAETASETAEAATAAAEAAAEEAEETVDYFAEAGISEEMFTVNNLWIMIAAMLVFIMHLGFACVESGLTRAKNTVNILFKNTFIVMIGIVMYAVCGWLIMYPGAGHEESLIANVFDFGFGIGAGGAYPDGLYEGITPVYNTGYTVWTDFFFQAMFAATCATIVSGAVAGRIKLLPFMIFSTLFVGLLYPMTGSWEWGAGWLDDMDFADFAGSTLVHAVGGAGALAGALVLGPRSGKYAPDGSVQPIPGHNMPLVTIGVFLLWFGWFGFNGGSELSANAGGVSYVLVTTALAACGGGLACGIASWVFGGKPDLTMALNGILAGLVGITAGPDTASWIEAILGVGAVSGVICYFSVLFFDKIRIDDPVGAISVHGVCGIYGTLCVAIFGDMSLFGVQLLGALSCVAVAFVFALIVFSLLKATIGLRVSEEEEAEGLDLGEHDMAAYPDFQRTYIKSYHAREI